MDARTKGIALQNATNAAAAIYAGLYDSWEESAFDQIRSSIFDANIEEIARFEAAEPVPTLAPAAGQLASVTPIGTPAAELAQALQPATTGPAPTGLGPAPAPAATNVAADKTDVLWQQLFDDYAAGRHALWYDNRTNNGQPNPKASINGGNGPDFKLKADTDKALWVNTKYGATPAWVKEKLGVA